MRLNKENSAILALSIVYISGILGILSSKSDWFLNFTPANLILSLFIIILFQKPQKIRLLFACVLVYILGFGFEVAGVNTGLIFGQYLYGQTLGYKLWGTPLVIGINWVLLIVCTASLSEKLLRKGSIIIKSAISAVLMVALDFLIEPVAIKYDFWCWDLGEIPVQNYIAWLAIAFGIQLLYFWIVRPINNRVADVLYYLQILFFAVLNLF